MGSACTGPAPTTWQTQAFRTAAADSPRTAKVMWTLTGVNYFGRAVIPMLWGVAALAYFSHKGGLEGITESIQAMPLFLVNLPAGLLGLLLACMLAAFMSTHSGYLLAWSGVLTEDLVAPDDPKMLPRGSWAGDAGVAHAFFHPVPGGVAALLGAVVQAAVHDLGLPWRLTGTMYVSGATALVAMGLYWRRANSRGAYLGLLGGALPGAIYLTLRVVALIVEPTLREHGHVAQTAIAKMSLSFSEPYMGLIRLPRWRCWACISGRCGASGRRIRPRVRASAPGRSWREEAHDDRLDTVLVHRGFGGGHQLLRARPGRRDRCVLPT